MEQPSQSLKRLVKGFFKGRELPSIPMIPITGLFAAKLAQLSVGRMLTDPTPFTNSLRDCYRLFGYHGVSLPIDTSLEAEACGCQVAWESEEKCPEVIGHPLEGIGIEGIISFGITSLEGRGRIPIFLDVLKRLDIEIGKQVALITPVTGPLTLAIHLAGESFMPEFREGTVWAQELIRLTTNLCAEVSKIYCNRKADLVIITEEQLDLLEPNHISRLIPAYKTLCNVIRFYRVNPILLVKHCRMPQMEEIFKLEADGIIVGSDIPLVELADLAVKNNRCFSKGIPESILLGPWQDAREAAGHMIREGIGRKGFFVSTGWEMPYQTPVENFHEIMKIIRT